MSPQHHRRRRGRVGRALGTASGVLRGRGRAGVPRIRLHDEAGHPHALDADDPRAAAILDAAARLLGAAPRRR
jgi:hypothetical protein